MGFTGFQPRPKVLIIKLPSKSISGRCLVVRNQFSIMFLQYTLGQKEYC